MTATIVFADCRFSWSFKNDFPALTCLSLRACKQYPGDSGNKCAERDKTALFAVRTRIADNRFSFAAINSQSPKHNRYDYGFRERHGEPSLNSAIWDVRPKRIIFGPMPRPLFEKNHLRVFGLRTKRNILSTPNGLRISFAFRRVRVKPTSQRVLQRNNGGKRTVYRADLSSR